LSNGDNRYPPRVLDGEILPPSAQRSPPPTPYPSGSMPDTAMRGFVAIFHRWGMTHITGAIEQQNRAEAALVQLAKTRQELAAVQGVSLELDAIRETARRGILNKLASEELARTEALANQQHAAELAAIDRRMALSAKKREMRVAEQIDKQESVAAVARAKQNATVAHRQLAAAQRISKADIERLVLDTLRERHNAFARMTDARVKAELAEAMRVASAAIAADENPSDDFTQDEFDALVQDFEAMEVRRGLSAGEQDLLNRLRAFRHGRRSS
jgi:hypothetical protein